MTGKPPATDRIAALLRGGGARRLVLVYDTRDQPAWTCELEIDGRLIALRCGANLQAAITSVADGTAQRLAELDAKGARLAGRRDPRGRA